MSLWGFNIFFIADHKEVSAVNHELFVTSIVFLGDIFYYIKSAQSTPFKVRLAT